jgi:hypothetical protein
MLVAPLLSRRASALPSARAVSQPSAYTEAFEQCRLARPRPQRNISKCVYVAARPPRLRCKQPSSNRFITLQCPLAALNDVF